MADTSFQSAMLDHHEEASLKHYQARLQEIAARGGTSACPPVRGPFFCTAHFKITVKNFTEAHIDGTINYPGGKSVHLEGDGELGVSISTDLTLYVVGILGPDPEQILGEVAWGVGGAGGGFGPINVSLMKPGCFIGDMAGLTFSTGAIAIVGRAQVTPG